MIDNKQTIIGDRSNIKIAFDVPDKSLLAGWLCSLLEVSTDSVECRAVIPDLAPSGLGNE